jgi:hypothetical protein
MKKKALVVIPMVLIFVNVFRGVDAFDAHLGSRFNLKAMCIWNIHDFPTYKLLVGVVIKGHVGCPPCGPSIDFSNSKKLKKIVYCGGMQALVKSPSLSMGIVGIQWWHKNSCCTYPNVNYTNIRRSSRVKVMVVKPSEFCKREVWPYA